MSLVVLNSTPLIALWSIGQLGLLRDLYGTVTIPAAVAAEFVAIEPELRQAALRSADWIGVRALGNPQQALAFVGLDAGEAEVLALAIEQPTRLVIIDELRGRRYAQRLGLPLTGTFGVLLSAKQQGFIHRVGPLLTQLQSAGLYIAPNLFAQVMRLAGESP